MNPTTEILNREIIALYQQQLERYLQLTQQKRYFLFDYLILSCEHILFVLEELLDESEDAIELINDYEVLLDQLRKDFRENDNTYSTSKRPYGNVRIRKPPI